MMMLYQLRSLQKLLEKTRKPQRPKVAKSTLRNLQRIFPKSNQSQMKKKKSRKRTQMNRLSCPIITWKRLSCCHLRTLMVLRLYMKTLL
jgi:hypothetical protein